MKIKYDLEEIIKAWDLYDLQGLIKIILNLNNSLLDKYSLDFIEHSGPTELEDIFKELFCGDSITFDEKKTVERLMLSCARENSIGF